MNLLPFLRTPLTGPFVIALAILGFNLIFFAVAWLRHGGRGGAP